MFQGGALQRLNSGDPLVKGPVSWERQSRYTIHFPLRSNVINISGLSISEYLMASDEILQCVYERFYQSSIPAV